MTEQMPATIRVADILVTGQDRLDGPELLSAIRAAIAENGIVRLSFEDVHTVTPTLVNEGMVPLLEDHPIETLRTQVLLVDVTRSTADIVRACMEHGVRWNNGEYGDSAMDRLMRPTMRDMGITVIEYRKEAMVHAPILADLPQRGYDHRARNAAPRSYRKR